MADREQFAAWFQRKLAELGLTDRAVAEAAGLTPQYVCMLRNAKKTNPRRQTVERLAAAMEVDAAEALAAASYPTGAPKPGLKSTGRSEEQSQAGPRCLCHLQFGQLEVQIELASAGETLGQVPLRLRVSTDPGGYCEELLHLGTPCEILLNSNEQHIRCELNSAARELVLRLPFSLLGSPAEITDE